MPDESDVSKGQSEQDMRQHVSQRSKEDMLQHGDLDALARRVATSVRNEPTLITYSCSVVQ